jgi:hypothetical protein
MVHPATNSVSNKTSTLKILKDRELNISLYKKSLFGRIWFKHIFGHILAGGPPNWLSWTTNQ